MGACSIYVSNQGDSTTSGIVNLAVSLLHSLKYLFLSGWGCTVDATTLTCTQNIPLQPGSAYTLLTLVGIGPCAPSPLIPTATVSVEGYVSRSVKECLRDISSLAAKSANQIPEISVVVNVTVQRML